MDPRSEIVIIGMSSLFPGSKNLHEYWHSLVSGKNSIREITPDRWQNEEYYSPQMTTENKMVSKWAGLLEDIKGFDFQFFNLLPEEARNMDPQSRLVLQEVWHCLEDAAIPPNELQKSTTSVYVGTFSLDYLQLMARTRTVEAYACHGNYPCMIANRISHFLNLSGASLSIDAACASSLVALHEAKLALRQGSCDYAIVAAANLICHPWHHIAFSKCRMLSPDGQCKTFDKDANGYVRGEGAAAILMTTKERAIKEGHRIQALVKGSAVNHCGGTRTISTPNFYAQKAVIEEALKDAAIKAEEIDYLETHGTGTALGDAIECHVLSEIFANKENLYIGSVKANIGHLEAAAGIAGLIKLVLMLQHGTIPRQLNLASPNPIIDFDYSPIKVALDNLSWEKGGGARFGGVSSFGFGGVNGHVILEEFLEEKSGDAQEKPVYFPLLFSARSQKSLERQIDNYKEFLKTGSLDIQNISYTLLGGRQHFASRAAFLCDTHRDLSSPISSLSLPKGPRIFYFGTLPQKSMAFLESLKPQILSKEENTRLCKNLSSEGINAYLIGKLLLNLNLAPLLFLGEGEGQSVAEELFQVTKTPSYYFDSLSQAIVDPHAMSLKQCRQIADSLGLIDQIDERLLSRVKALSDQQFAFKKVLTSFDNLLKPYGLSILLLDQIPPEPRHKALLNLALLLVIDEFYKKYQLPNRYCSSYPVLGQIDEWIRKGKVSLQEAFSIVHNPSETLRILQKNPPSLELLAKDHLVVKIGESKRIFPQQVEYLSNKDPLKEFFHLLIALWLSGEEIRWDRFTSYFYPNASAVSLPGYSFETTSFWCSQ
jgi:3-oxoacyl-(acyl-carrier-protein) synthase